MVDGMTINRDQIGLYVAIGAGLLLAGLLVGFALVRGQSGSRSEPDGLVVQSEALPSDYFAVAPPPPPEPPVIEISEPIFPLMDLIDGNASSQVIIRVNNLGPGIGDVSEPTLKGAGEFSLENLCPSHIGAGDTCDILVNFASNTFGTFRGAVDLAVDGQPKTLRLIADVAKPYVEPPAPAAPPPAPDGRLLAFRELVRQVEASRSSGGPGFVSNGVLVRENARPVVSELLYDLDDDDYGDLREDESTKRVDRTRMITQDRLLWAVLRTPINTQVGGFVLAAVDQHIFGGDGRLLLIPKGSQLIGEYESLEEIGDSRLEVKWTRVLRPDGSSISFEGIAGDAQGKAGLVGEVDNRNWERFGTPFVTAVLGAAVSGITGGTGDGALNDSADQLTQQLAQVTATTLEDQFNVAPVITVAAGERILIKPMFDISIAEPVVTASNSSE